MARARNIKPAFFQNEELIELPAFDRLLFIGLWTIADREGRLEDRPKRIKMQLFPADEYDVDGGLNALAARGFVRRYGVGDDVYMQIVNFARHQSPHHRELPSEIPAEGSSPGPAPSKTVDNETKTQAQPTNGTPSPGPAPVQPRSSRADTGYLNPDTGYLNPSTTAPGAQTTPGPVVTPVARPVIAAVPERNAPQVPPNPPEPPPDDVPPAQPFDLLDALCDEVGADVSVLARPQKDKQLGVAKRLVESGMTVRDVRAMTRWLLGQEWVTSGVDLFLLEKQLGKWQMQGKPAVAVVRSRGRPTATESVFDEALDETRRKRGQPDDNVFDIA